MAIHTGLRNLDRGWVVAFPVKVGGKLEDFPGTEFDAVSAPFATIFKDMNYPDGDLDIFGIKWNAPKIHTPFPSRTRAQKI